MKIGMIPYIKKANHYSNLIREVLTTLGHDVLPLNPHKIFPLMAFDDKTIDVYFVYWIHPFYQGSTPLRTVVKSLTFLFFRRKLKKVRYILSVENFVTHDTKLQFLDAWVMTSFVQNAESVLFSTEKAASVFFSLYPSFKSKRTFVIPHPTYQKVYGKSFSSGREEARAELNVPNDATVCLYFGLLRRYKGVSELITLFGKIWKPNRFLLICGRYENESVKRDLFEAISVLDPEAQKNILLFGGFVSDAELPKYFMASDFFAVNYLREPANPGSPVLAMDFGLPVYGASTGCLPEILGRKNMYGYDPEDFFERISALDHAFSDNNRKEKVIGLAQVREDRHSENVLRSIYDSILGGMQ